MSKKRESVRGKGHGLGLITKASSKPKEEDSRNIETKKNRTLYEQGNFQLFPEQNKKIRVYAAQNKMKVSEVVRRALDAFFEKEGL
jgi:hypothetical protein